MTALLRLLRGILADRTAEVADLRDTVVTLTAERNRARNEAVTLARRLQTAHDLLATLGFDEIPVVGPDDPPAR